MTIRRLTLYLALALLLLSPGGALGSPVCSAPDGACLGVTDHGAQPDRDASTSSEAPAPLLERAAPPRYESGRLTAACAASTADGRLPEIPSPEPERLSELTVPSVSTPLFLNHCAFLC